MSSSRLEYHLISRLKFKQLKLLVAVDEQKNILRASKQLNMAQPAATKYIRDLEEMFEVELFKRSSRGVTPTAYGDVVIKHAKTILSQVQHVSEEVTSLKQGVIGRIKVGTLLAASPTLIPQSLLHLKKERPKIYVTIVEGTNDKLMPALRNGELDIVIGRLPEYREREDLKQSILYNEPIAVVAREGHPLTKKKTLTFDDIRDQEWILPLAQTSLRRQIEFDFRNAGHEPPADAIESISILTNHNLLLKTDMIATMPYQVAKSYPDLVRLPITLKSAISPVGITIRADAVISPTLNYFIETLTKISKELQR